MFKSLGDMFWSVYALCYDAIRVLTPYQEMLRGIVRAVQSAGKTPLTILEVGCGTGNVIQVLCRSFPDANITGADYSSQMLKRARRKNQGGRIDFLKADLTNPLPFGDQSFDLVVCSNVLYTLKNGEEVLGELRRVLSPSGILVISDPRKGSSFMKIFWSHLLSGGWSRVVVRIAALVAYLVIIPELIYVGVANIVIELARKSGTFYFRDRTEWESILDTPRIEKTYADQNWLIVWEKE